MLKRDDSTLGLWRSDNGNGNGAGAHALVIGVSDYPYLSGGSAPPAERAPDSGGLAQLEVSALSGALFFDWLRNVDSVAGAPVASCRLLLAPRPDEAAKVQALTEGYYQPAQYEAIRTALIAWGDQLAFAGKTQGANVALFFFSGHGVEVAAAPAILASDVFDQKAADGGINKALALDPMTLAVRSYNIDRGLFFIDACRDSPKIARLLNLAGDQPLRVNPQPSRRVDAMIRLQSTASGLSSYQVAADPGTIFTQAVLDGLNGPPPSYLPYDTSNVPWQLLFSALEGHTKRKVMESLRERSPLALQTVEPYGYPYNAGMLVAVKSGPKLGGAVLESIHTESRAPPVTLESVIQSEATKVLAGASAIAGTQLAQRRGGRAAGTDDLRDFGLMHDILGHEYLTRRWIDSLEFLDGRTGERAAADALRIANAHRQELEGRVAVWIDLAIRPNPGGVLWIGAANHTADLGTAIVVPQDRYFSIPLRLDVNFTGQDRDCEISTLSARLADPAGLDESIPDAWKTLWHAQKVETFADLASAGRAVEQGRLLQDIVDEKRNSPIAAALAINLLLRSNGLDYLHDWPRNLAKWFDWLPDGPALWAETLLRRHEYDPGDYPPEALEYFLMLAERGPPLLSNSLAVAVRQAAFWRERHAAGQLKNVPENRLEQALGAVERAGKYLASGGAFARFLGPRTTISPGTVLGARAKQKRAQAAA